MKTQFIKFLINTKLMLGLAVAVGIAGITTSIWQDDWIWFSRVGSITVLIGAAISGRRLIRLGVKELYDREYLHDHGDAIPTSEEDLEIRQTGQDLMATREGLLVVALGTLIWGWGDLLGALV